jgi:hypothetical protein
MQRYTVDCVTKSDDFVDRIVYDVLCSSTRISDSTHSDKVIVQSYGTHYIVPIAMTDLTYLIRTSP